MTIYYLTIIIFVVVGYGYDRMSWREKSSGQGVFLLFFAVVFSLIFGSRYKVGVDWYNYIEIYNKISVEGFIFNSLEVSYKLINLLSYYFNGGIGFVIFVCTVVFFIFTMFSFPRLALNPFYFFAITAPYHLVMSGVNYTRQAVALSIFLYALSFLINGNKKYFSFFILLASTFHASALLFFPMLFIDYKKRYLFFVLSIVCPIVVYMMLGQYIQYLQTDLDSSGLYLRATYLLFPTLLLLMNYRRINSLPLVLKRFCFLTILSFPLVLVISGLSSTLADRFAYYFILIGTLTWMLVRKECRTLSIFSLNSLSNYILFFASLTALITWHAFSNYSFLYEFDSVIFYWW